MPGWGDRLAWIEGYYDQRITQKLTLRPAAEFNFAAGELRNGRQGVVLAAAQWVSLHSAPILLTVRGITLRFRRSR